MKSTKSKEFGFFGRMKFAIANAVTNAPTFFKVTLYMSGPFVAMFFLGYPIWAGFGDYSHLVYWPLAFYVFVGVNVAIKSIKRERILNEPFSLNLFVSIALGAFIWPWLMKKST